MTSVFLARATSGTINEKGNAKGRVKGVGQHAFGHVKFEVPVGIQGRC